MITNFKTYENESKSISFIPNDIIVEFDCLKCLKNNEHGWGETQMWSGKHHKGLVRGIGYGYNFDDKIHLTLTLNRIKYNHNVDVNKPIIVYGDIPDDLYKIIDETNMMANSKKYNL